MPCVWQRLVLRAVEVPLRVLEYLPKSGAKPSAHWPFVGPELDKTTIPLVWLLKLVAASVTVFANGAAVTKNR